MTGVKLSEEEVLHEIELEQLEISKIKRQRELIQQIEGVVGSRDQEIIKLKALVHKYQPAYHQTTELRLELAEKDSSNRTLAAENQFLRREFQQLLQESAAMTDQLRELERQN